MYAGLRRPLELLKTEDGKYQPELELTVSHLLFVMIPPPRYVVIVYFIIFCPCSSSSSCVNIIMKMIVESRLTTNSPKDRLAAVAEYGTGWQPDQRYVLDRLAESVDANH